MSHWMKSEVSESSFLLICAQKMPKGIQNAPQNEGTA